MNKHKTTAFTLVELIVVITILAVLATVAFISFQGYTSSSRDSVRLADLKNITKSFELLKTRDQQLPLPDQSINITATGVTFQYQGVLEEPTLKKNGIHNGGLDPQTKEPYGYVVNTQRNKFQVIGFLENSSVATNNIFTQSLADNTDKYIKTSGDVLGILLDTTTNEVITTNGGVTDIDVVQTTDNYKMVLKKDIEQGDNTVLSKINTIQKQGLYTSCKDILKAKPELLNQDGNHIISPNETSVFEVFCDMTTDGGGWTLLAFANGTSTAMYSFDDIRIWNPVNSDNCDLTTECLSKTGRTMKTWNELMVYTRGYKVKGTQCNDKSLSIYGYTQLPALPASTTTINYAHGICDDILEVSQGLSVSTHATGDAAWEIDMGVMDYGNEPEEYSVLGYGPRYIPDGLGNKRGSYVSKVHDFYGVDASNVGNDWDSASTNQQTWFIR